MMNSELTTRFGSTDAMQHYFLLGVSRTFALTIPALPNELRPVISNGYLLCRIIDCIEDDTGLDIVQKKAFARQFIRVVAGEEGAGTFSHTLLPLLSDTIIPAEKELIQYTPEVIAITHGFNDDQRRALNNCVQIMGEGMMHYQQQDTTCGLQDMTDVENYCYCVAGVVGEMLTQLYCNYSAEIKAKSSSLMQLSVCFGQGLQMTNIIKDIWTDKANGVCWLPRAEFKKFGFDLDLLAPGINTEDFAEGLTEFTGIARHRLDEALEYTLMIPRKETGIRNFCLFAIGMAILTLRKTHQAQQFLDGHNLKISRNSVRLVMILSRFFVRCNSVLRILYRLAGRGVPNRKTVVVMEKSTENT